MKLLLSLIMLSLSIPMANGQVLNPYSDFGYIPKNKYISTVKGITIENKDTTENISSMVIDMEKSEVLLYGNDSVVLDHISISEKDILRFLSVDPLTRQYPELTPYQFASNRPIDGIDLDGLEWTKTKTYDTKTGVTNIQFQVKLKIKNESEVFKDLEGLKNEIIAQFPGTFKDVTDGKTTYSGSIAVEFVSDFQESDFATVLYDNPGDPAGGLTTFINTKRNKNRVNVYDTRKAADPNTPRAAKDVAQDLLHELIHTAGPNHTDDANQAEDIQLITTITYTPDGQIQSVNNKPGPNADLDKITHNIMSYPNVKVNGKKIKEYVPNRYERNKVSPGQINQIIHQIDTDEQQKK